MALFPGVDMVKVYENDLWINSFLLKLRDLSLQPY